MRIGVPKESWPGERRVAAIPESVEKLKALGFEVRVERGAGAGAGYEDAAYEAAGAEVTPDRERVFDADVLVKVRPPSVAEAEALRTASTLVSLIQPERNPELLAILVRRRISAVGLERIPRTTRAQKMDVLSSTANLAGYRAVIAAAEHYQASFGPLVTAAGSMPPAKVLVIGAGVAGLAAIAAARALGAEVRAFDTRAAAREQVESLGASFLEVSLKESGEGGGGYAKEMSPEFIAAEMALFKAQAVDVTIVITTALVPGKKAPTLLPRDVVEAFGPGTVIVDMAAEQGGNCELCVPGEVVVHRGVTIVGFTDLPSRVARAASKFFGANIVALLGEMGGGKDFRIDLGSDVVRPALLTHAGEALPVPPRKEPSPQPAPVRPSQRPSGPAPTPSLRPSGPSLRPAGPSLRPSMPARSLPPPKPKPRPQRAWGSTFAGLVGIGALFALGGFAPGDFLQHFTVFVLACFVGWQVIWSVTPALHTPLMSVTNAVSGIIVVGGMLQIGGELDLASILGAIAVLVATINVSGGFLVTQRMLRMFRKE